MALLSSVSRGANKPKIDRMHESSIGGFDCFFDEKYPNKGGSAVWSARIFKDDIEGKSSGCNSKDQAFQLAVKAWGEAQARYTRRTSGEKNIELVVDETKRKRKKSLRDTRHTMDNMASSSESAGKSSQSADSPHFERDKKARTKTSKKRPNETDEGMERIAIENNNPFKESFEKEKNEPPQETNGKTMTTSGKKSRPQSVIANNEQHPFTDLANSDPPEDKTVGSAVVRKRSSSTSKHKRKSSKSSDSSPSLNSSRQKISQLEENDEEDSHDHKHGHTGEPSMLRHNHHNESNNLNATVVNEAAPTRKLTLRAKFMRLVGLTDKDGNDGNKQ